MNHAAKSQKWEALERELKHLEHIVRGLDVKNATAGQRRKSEACSWELEKGGHIHSCRVY
jgi:hypothetical protein